MVRYPGNDSREKIFGAIRRGLRDSEKVSAKRETKSPLKKPMSNEFKSLFAKFSAELRQLGGDAAIFDDEKSAKEFVSNHAGESIFVYDELAPWSTELSQHEEKIIRTSSDFDYGYDKRDAAVFDFAIMPCHACVAETGTVAIANKIRLPAAFATKLFIIAEPEKLIPSLDELFTDENKNFQTSNFFLITGPSRTADIEKELVTGVHGPKEIYVIFISRNPQS